MSKHKIDNHPTILCQNDISEICKPLLNLNITYFSHARVKDNEFTAIANHPMFHRHYLKKKYYNADIHMAKDDFIKDYILWDSIDKQGDSLKLDEEAAEMGVKHTFTIIDKQGGNYYHFGTSLSLPSINQVYLSNIDLLKLFIMNFNSQVSGSVELAQAYNIKFSLNDKHGAFLYENMNLDRKELINYLSENNSIRFPNGKLISKTQLKILYWLHNGKTISQIAALIHLAEITIHKQVADLKYKLNCYTQFQLGEAFSALLLSSPELIESIIKI